MMKKQFVAGWLVMFGLSTGLYAEPASVSVVEKIVDVQHQLFSGPRPGLRSNHTKGIVVVGEFTPSETAKNISEASHLQTESSPAVVRFSNATGFPDIADNDPRGMAKGIAIRLDLGDEEYHDLVFSSVPMFPVSTPELFLEMLTAVSQSGPDVASPKPIETFLEAHPSAKRFVQHPKPFPKSFASLSYHGVNAFRFINAQGDAVYGRYILSPVEGEQHLDAETGKQQHADYLVNELPQRLQQNAVLMRLSVQLAGPDDEVNDATVIWPEDRPVVELGLLKLEAMHEDAAAFEGATMFNPLALPDGIEISDDPVLRVRPAAYAISFSHRMN
ncbi:catalase family peroxidase [Methylophaga lonarensis]|uniref:catalase family peroxidase n=1 Tax=Methylophaga lonarensis TaxID=999151 RepID=UPI003D27F37B